MLLPIQTAVPQHVGEQILLLRNRAGWTQTELARRAGVALITVIRVENGKTARPRPETIQVILHALGVEIEVDEPTPAARTFRVVREPQL